MKKKEFRKNTAVFLLSLPLLIFAGVTSAVMVYHGQKMAGMLSLSFFELYADQAYIIVGAFIVCFFLETFACFYTINSYVDKAKSFEVLNAEQDRGAQLLVRRDFELTKANERLEQLNQAKSGFISVVAHQLRTPLSGIKWTLNLLLNGDLGGINEEQRSFLSKAYDSNDRIISLINDMLGADRIESGKVHYAFKPLRLTDLIDAVLQELHPQILARKLGVRVTFSPKNFPLVRADSEKLRAVFQNLLENSVKYSHEGGTIEVRFAVEKLGEALVSIKDDGIGIPPKQQKYIFERFFRAQNAMSLEAEGSGLGLFIAKSIIDAHGGRIWFKSEAERGVTFYFTIPMDTTSA